MTPQPRHRVTPGLPASVPRIGFEWKQNIGEKLFPCVGSILCIVDGELARGQTDSVSLAFGSLMLADVAYSITTLILDSADSVDTVTNLLEDFDQPTCEVKLKND